jgi:hypothetical protein
MDQSPARSERLAPTVEETARIVLAAKQIDPDLLAYGSQRTKGVGEAKPSRCGDGMLILSMA